MKIQLRVALSAAGIAAVGWVCAQNPLFIPEALQGTEFNLELQNGEVQFFDGPATATMGANGSILAPTLIMQRDENVTLNVTNNLGEMTTIHWHGMHVPAQADGGPHVIIPEGETWSPSFPVLDWASTYWYHPHLHEHTNEHVVRGISGFIIVKDDVEAALELPRTYGVDDIPLLIQTKAFDSQNQVLHDSELDTCLMVNATIDPFWNAPAQVVRLRLLNGSSLRYFNLGFNGNLTFQQIGTDGGLLTAPVALTRLLLAPGERAEILVDLTGMEGQSLQMKNYAAAGQPNTMSSGIYGAAQPGMGPGQSIPGYTSNPLNGADFTILDIHVGEATAEPVTTIPAALVAHDPWLEADVMATRQLVFSPVNMGPNAIAGPFVINNMPFDMMMINYEIPFENIEVWELRNQTPIGHPFHIHHIQFYVLDINGVAPPPNLQGRKDVIHVPGGNTTVRFITRFETYFDEMFPYMYHCHMLPHEDEGMMGQYVVLPPCGVSIDAQPMDASAVEGTVAQFTIGVSSPTATFQWQSDAGFGFLDLTNAGQYSGVNTATLTVSSVTLANNNQLFRCNVQDEGCGIYTEEVVLSVSPDGVSESDPDLMSSVSPNPLSDWFVLNTGQGLRGARWMLTDATGRNVMEGIAISDRTRVDASMLSAGLYSLRFTDLPAASPCLVVVGR